MKTISATKCVYVMSADNEPIASVKLGERFAVQTKDCYSNTIRTEKDTFTADKYSLANPATGPIFVDGAEPKQILAVHIHQIRPAEKAVMYIEPGMGALSRHITGPETKRLARVGQSLRFDGKLKLKVDPMIGVIGTAPAGKGVATFSPGEHGGNLDCKHIKAGSVVYLPVRVPGALLAMGDVHALMADGEVVICGAETPARIVCSCQVVPPDTVATPAVRTKDKLMLMASARTLDRAQRLVLDKAMRFLTGMSGLSANTAAMLLSLVGDLAVCQVVDPLKTMRIELPLDVLSRYGKRFE